MSLWPRCSRRSRLAPSTNNTRSNKGDRPRGRSPFLLCKKVQFFVSFDEARYTGKFRSFSQLAQIAARAGTSPYPTSKACTFATAPSCEREACSKRPCIRVCRGRKLRGKGWNRQCGAKGVSESEVAKVLALLDYYGTSLGIAGRSSNRARKLMLEGGLVVREI